MLDVQLRPAREEDVPGLLRILREPSVARWWGEIDEADVREELAISFKGRGIGPRALRLATGL